MKFKFMREATKASRARERAVRRIFRRIGSVRSQGFLFRALGVLEGLYNEDPGLCVRIFNEIKDDIPLEIRDIVLDSILNLTS